MNKSLHRVANMGIGSVQRAGDIVGLRLLSLDGLACKVGTGLLSRNLDLAGPYESLMSGPLCVNC